MHTVFLAWAVYKHRVSDALRLVGFTAAFFLTAVSFVFFTGVSCAACAVFSGGIARASNEAAMKNLFPIILFRFG